MTNGRTDEWRGEDEGESLQYWWQNDKRVLSGAIVVNGYI